MKTHRILLQSSTWLEVRKDSSDTKVERKNICTKLLSKLNGKCPLEKKKEKNYRFIAKHSLSFVEENKLLRKYQYGFRRYRWAVTQLIGETHDQSARVDKGGQIDVIFLDFAEAFARVSSPQLLHKLKYIINNDPILTCLEAYFVRREQFVQLTGRMSEKLSVILGVPLGCVLGLFILYISDVSWRFHAGVKSKHFANGISIYSKIQGRWSI